jgi:hypothetical protein
MEHGDELRVDRLTMLPVIVAITGERALPLVRSCLIISMRSGSTSGCSSRKRVAPVSKFLSVWNWKPMSYPIVPVSA